MCNKKLTDRKDEVYTLEDTEVPKMLDHITSLKLFQKVKSLFAAEAKHYSREIQDQINMNITLKNIVAKQFKFLIEIEQKFSTIDLRSIFSNQLSRQQID